MTYRSTSGEYAPVCADGWTAKHSDVVCGSLGYSSSMPMDKTETLPSGIDVPFYTLINDTTEGLDLNSKSLLVNLNNSNRICESGKLVEVSCHDFCKYTENFSIYCIKKKFYKDMIICSLRSFPKYEEHRSGRQTRRRKWSNDWTVAVRGSPPQYQELSELYS